MQIVAAVRAANGLPAARAARAAHRAAFAAARGIDPAMPWLVVAAMMRPGDKRASYEALAAALAQLRDRAWHLLVAGDGDARPAVTAVLEAAAPGRVTLLGALDAATLAATCAAGDLFVWPAVNEAYGMSMLEAQAAGLPVVAGGDRGVADVVAQGEGGLIVSSRDAPGFAAAIARLLDDPAARAGLARSAALRVHREHGLDTAAARLAAVRSAKTWGTVCFVGEGGDVTLDVSRDMLRKQLTLVGSWTFSAMGMGECARFVAERRIPLARLITHRFKLDQAAEAYRLFDTQTTGKGVFVF